MKRIVLAFLFLCVPAMAQVPARPPLIYDPDKVEYATPWAQSSPCLGDYSDLFCLASTVVICGVLRERSECQPRGRYQPHDNPLAGNRVEYRIVRAGYVPISRLWFLENRIVRATEYDTDHLTRDRAVAAQIVIRQKICDPRRPLCESDRELDFLVNLRRRGDRWDVLSDGIFYADLWAAE